MGMQICGYDIFERQFDNINVILDIHLKVLKGCPLSIVCYSILLENTQMLNNMELCDGRSMVLDSLRTFNGMERSS